ncbi:hypothetical protein AB5I41_09550 [Sphingomonas sp. MMS24-JH45]
MRAALGFDYIDQRTTVRSGATATLLNLDRTRTVFGRLSGDLVGRGGGRLPDTSLERGDRASTGAGVVRRDTAPVAPPPARCPRASGAMRARPCCARTWTRWSARARY